MGRARSMRPSAIIRPLWSTTTAVTAMSIFAAWAWALRTIWIALSPGIAIVARHPPRPGRGPRQCSRKWSLRIVLATLVNNELLAQDQVLEGDLLVAADDEGEEPKQGSTRVIMSRDCGGPAPTDQSLGAG